MTCKCCGYEHHEDYGSGKLIKTGDEKFVRIDLLGRAFETDVEEDSWSSEYKKAYLYGCPKCNTVQFEFIW